MKFIKLKNIALLALVFSTIACEDFIGGDFNADPNKPNAVPISGILPQTQISLADTYGGSFSRWNSMFTQQVEGVARQWSAFNQYVITPNRFDDSWSDYFENVLVELRTVNQIATDNEYNHYLGISNVLEAFMIMTSTDVWGDMPYTEAGLGAENFNPAFDDQATVIYPAVRQLLLDAITLFGQGSGALAPGSDDLYYSGDVAAWTNAAHALLARYYLHLDDYANALAEAQQSFASRADNMSYTYGAAPFGGQWYRFNDGRTGDIEFHPTMRALMTGLNDTDRLGVLDNVFTTTGHPYLVDAFRQDLISYRETQFIIAEAEFRLNGATATAQTAYLNGINAGFQELGFDASGAEYAAYVAQAAIDPAVTLDLDRIMTQKYIAMFVQPENFSDWRRTGIPALTPVSGTQIPRRWDYSFNEYLFNANAPAQDANILYERVDWD